MFNIKWVILRQLTDIGSDQNNHNSDPRQSNPHIVWISLIPSINCRMEERERYTPKQNAEKPDPNSPGASFLYPPDTEIILA